MREELEKILNEKVRPALKEHGGTVEILELDGAGVLRVRLGGRCANCPAAGLTTESLIEKEVTEAMPAVKQVVLVQSVSDALLREARAFLQHE